MAKRFEDSRSVEFRSARRAQRRVPAPYAWGWWLLAVVCAICLVLVVRALLARTAWTAGPSPVAEHVASSVQEAPVDAPEYLPMPTPMVYRCVDRKGAVSFQSAPCGPGQRTTKVIPAPPEMEPPRRAPSRQPSVSTATPSVHWTASDPAAQRRAAARAGCLAARQQREAVLQAVGLKRNYDLLQRLDEAVRRACKDG